MHYYDKNCMGFRIVLTLLSSIFKFVGLIVSLLFSVVCNSCYLRTTMLKFKLGYVDSV